MPDWVTLTRGDTLENLAFMSGAALAHLHGVVGHADVPMPLLRERLALRAAAACVALSGRPERAADLRDAVHLLREGEHPGPAGEVFQHWRRAVERPLSTATLHRALTTQTPEQIAAWLAAGQGAPGARAVAVITAVLAEAPRAQVAALMLADAAVARALGWDHMLPLLAAGLKPRDLRGQGDDLRQACCRALVTSATEVCRLAAELARGAGRLNAVTPKLRAKGAGGAVARFLTRDALAPAALTDVMSDRAARRLCDRLVALGAVRELSGRDTFRLYGL